VILSSQITIRSTGKARYPRASERLVTWVVPMRTGDQRHPPQRRQLPQLRNDAQQHFAALTDRDRG
jgi:hypothetical protein